jgi:3D (Asp-Asp-Asp) domain-containing protein
MRRTILTPIRMVMTSILSFGAVAAGQSQTAKSKLNNLPPAVATALADNRPGAEVDKLTIEKEHGITVYDFEFKASQGEMDVVADGTVLDLATVVQMKDIPEAVAATIRSAAKKRPIKQLTRSEVWAEIVSEQGKGRVSKLATPKYVYEAEFPRGEVEVAPDGKIIKQGK